MQDAENEFSLNAKTKTIAERDKEIIRLERHYLQELGLDRSAEALARESLCQLDHPIAGKCHGQADHAEK
jgi:hypothetical protein